MKSSVLVNETLGGGVRLFFQADRTCWRCAPEGVGGGYWGWHTEGGIGSAHLPTYTLSYFSVSHSFPILHSLLLPHVRYPEGLAFGVNQVGGNTKSNALTKLSHLAEFQNPTNFERNCEFYCSTFYRAPKITKIIICVLYMRMYLHFYFLRIQLVR